MKEQGSQAEVTYQIEDATIANAPMGSLLVDEASLNGAPVEVELTPQEIWKQRVTELFVFRGVPEERARAGVDWAVRWERACRDLCAKRFKKQHKATDEEMRAVIEDGRQMTAERLPDEVRTRSGQPMLSVERVANQTFLLIQGKNADKIKPLLDRKKSSLDEGLLEIFARIRAGIG